MMERFNNNLAYWKHSIILNKSIYAHILGQSYTWSVKSKYVHNQICIILNIRINSQK